MNRITIGNPWIAYVGPFGFPNGGAAARRVMGNAQSIVEAGYEVTIASGQNEIDIKNEEIPAHIKIVSIGERNAEHLPSALKRLHYIGMGAKTRNWLQSQKQKPSAVIVYSGYSPYLLRLVPYCKKEGIPILFDAVEWYQQENFIKNLLSPYQANINLAMRVILPKMDGIIAISSYLEKYYKNKGCTTIKTPPTIDTKLIKPRIGEKKDTKIKMAYTGTPTKKDCLDEIIEGVILSNKNKIEVELNIAGITEKNLLNYPALKKNNLKLLPPYIICHGIISHQEATNLVRNCDFSVLLRRINRVSTAGFPTKLVESLCVGTPPILNITSDIGEYIENNKNGFICPNPTAIDLSNLISKAAALNKEEYIKMRISSRHTAEKYFDFHSHTKNISELLKYTIDQKALSKNSRRTH